MGSGRIIEGRFELGERVKRHEPGESFFAVDRSGGQDVVLRILPGTFGDESRQTTFFEKIQSLVKMNGKHLEKVLDAGVTEGGAPYVVMERIKGTPLDQIIGREAPMAVMRAVEICRQIAFGLGDASRAGCIHGRLSPRLVTVSAGKRGKGVEKVKITGYAPWDLSDGRAAFDFEVVAPEVILGADPDIRSDCYAMGVILYLMLTGRSPFTAASREALTLAHLNDRIDVPSVARGDREIPPALDNLVLRLLEKNPDKRLGAPDVILVHLESIRSGEQDSGIGTQDAEHPSVDTTAEKDQPEADSDLDEGISFASGRRIKTTDFQSIKVTELMGTVGAQVAEPTAPLGRLEPIHAPGQTGSNAAGMKPATDAGAAFVPAATKGKTSTMAIVVVSGVFFLAAVAVTGWFVLQYQTRKMELAAHNQPTLTQVRMAEPTRAAAGIVPTTAEPPSPPSDELTARVQEPSDAAGQVATAPSHAQPEAAPPTPATESPARAAATPAQASPAPEQTSTTKAQAPAVARTPVTTAQQVSPEPAKPAIPAQARTSSSGTESQQTKRAARTAATTPKPPKAAAAASPGAGAREKPGRPADGRGKPAASKPGTASGGSSVDWFDGLDEKPSAKPAAKDKPKKDSGTGKSEPVLNWDE